MNVAERSAFHNTSSTFSNLHSVIPLGVMGILLAVAHATARTLLIGLSLFIVGMLVPTFLLQLRRFSVFPSLLSESTFSGRARRYGRSPDAASERKGSPLGGRSL